MIAKLK